MQKYINKDGQIIENPNYKTLYELAGVSS